MNTADSCSRPPQGPLAKEESRAIRAWRKATPPANQGRPKPTLAASGFELLQKNLLTLGCLGWSKESTKQGIRVVFFHRVDADDE